MPSLLHSRSGASLSSVKALWRDKSSRPLRIRLLHQAHGQPRIDWQRFEAGNVIAPLQNLISELISVFVENIGTVHRFLLLDTKGETKT